MYFASKGLENLMKFMAHLTQVSACSSRSHVSVVLKTENFQSNATKGREKGKRKVNHKSLLKLRGRRAMY